MFSVLAPKKSRVRFSNIMEIRQLPSSHALEAKLSRMSYPTVKDQESILKTVGKLTATQVAKISFFFCFVVSVFLRFTIAVHVCAVWGGERGVAIAGMWRSEDPLRKSLMPFHICVCSGIELKLSGLHGRALPAGPSCPVLFLPYLRWCTYQQQCSIEM